MQRSNVLLHVKHGGFSRFLLFLREILQKNVQISKNLCVKHGGFCHFFHVFTENFEKNLQIRVCYGLLYNTSCFAASTVGYCITRNCFAPALGYCHNTSFLVPAAGHSITSKFFRRLRRAICITSKYFGACDGVSVLALNFSARAAGQL